MDEWRTNTVIQMWNHITENRDWGRLPILADALQYGGYDVEDVLGAMRTPGRSEHDALRLIALVRSERTKEAVETIEGLLKQAYDLKYDTLMNGADNFVNHQSMLNQHGATGR